MPAPAGHRRRPGRAALGLTLATFLMPVPALHGALAFEGRLESTALGEARLVRVHTPPSYALESTRRYPVLYAHDGQNLFTSAGTNIAFGWGNWALDQTADQLAHDGRVREFLIVAIDHSPRRYQEYRGRARPYTATELAALKRPPPAAGDETAFRAYARFLIHELKPCIDREFRTLPDAAHTATLGASLGGICSVTLAWEYPESFGAAASLSGSFQIEGRYFLERVLKAHSGAPKPVRLYLDSGTVDYAGGDDGCKLTAAVAAELERLGWQPGTNLCHYVDATPLDEPALRAAGLREDKWKEARTSQHNEFYWRLRLWRPLTFLFPPVPDSPSPPAPRRPRAPRRGVGPGRRASRR